MTLPRSTLSAAVTALFLAAGLVACDDDATGPDSIERSDVVGAYAATTFDVTVDGETTDQLDAGVQFTVTLESDGTTTGQLFVPGGGEEGGDVDDSLEGTWSWSAAEPEVTFDHDADTFVRDMTFAATRAGGTIQLEGVDTFGEAGIEVVLTQQ